jgi:hypothetical protein
MGITTGDIDPAIAHCAKDLDAELQPSRCSQHPVTPLLG